MRRSLNHRIDAFDHIDLPCWMSQIAENWCCPRVSQETEHLLRPPKANHMMTTSQQDLDDRAADGACTAQYQNLHQISNLLTSGEHGCPYPISKAVRSQRMDEPSTNG